MAQNKISKAQLADAVDYLRHWENHSNDPDDTEGRERRRENYDQVVNE